MTVTDYAEGQFLLTLTPPEATALAAAIDAKELPGPPAAALQALLAQPVRTIGNRVRSRLAEALTARAREAEIAKLRRALEALA